MERIKLTSREKKVMRLLQAGNVDALSEFDAPALVSLQAKGLARVAWADGDVIDDARLTTMGKEYIGENPKLCNPVNWAFVFQAIAAVGAVIAAITGMVVLFACSRLLTMPQP